MKRSAYIFIDYGKGNKKKIFLDKEITCAGSDKGTDIVLDFSYVPSKYFEITKKGDVYVFRALTEEGVTVSGEVTFEKILEPGDYFSLGDLRAEYFPPEEQEETEGRTIAEKYFKKMIVYALIAIAIVFIGGKVFLTMQETIVKREIAKRQTRDDIIIVEENVEMLSEQELISLLAEVKRRDMIANYLLTQSNIDLSNYAYAVWEWLKALEKLENVQCQPKIKAQIVEETADTKVKVKKIVEYMRKNAFVAHQQGCDGDIIRLLDNIMKILDDPEDPDYIWAKKKYLGMMK